MKIFFNDFKRSLSDWKFYKEIEEGQHKPRISYPIFLALISSLVISIMFTVSLYTLLLPGARTLLNEHVPEDIVMTLKSGELSINQPVPYMFPLSGQDKKNLLVIDTNAGADVNAISKYDTYIFVNKDTLIMEEESNKISVHSLKEFPDATISRNTMSNVLDSSYSYVWMLPIVVFIFMAILNFIGLLIMFIIAGFLLFVILKIASRTVRYIDAVLIVMYAYTFVFIVDLFLMLIRGNFNFGLSILCMVFLGCLFVLMKHPHYEHQ